MNNTPILIPMKGISRRCPEKNRKLLPFTVHFLTAQNCMNNAIAISDCPDLLESAEKFGLKTCLEVREERQDELVGKNGVDCYSKNGHAVTVLTRQS